MNKLTAEEVKKLAERLRSLAEKLKWHNVTHAQDVLMAADLIAAQGVIALPILEQQEQGEGGWIEWNGGTRPVSSSVIVEPKLRTGKVIPPDMAVYWDWGHCSSDLDIIAYRIIPERATNQNGEQ